MKKEAPNFIKGRGAQINTADPFAKYVYDNDPKRGETNDISLRTQFIKVHPKTILNKVKSPDVYMDYSLNPYQGCEHGCVYCYARNTHPYWGYSAGLEFEQKILYKEKAATLLDQKLRHKNWVAKVVSLSGNTDCYQPIEAKLGITRSLLEVFWKYRHPVGIITKNSLVLRDLDLLKKLSSHNLVKVVITITTLDENLRLLLEPRTATTQKRLLTVRQLSEAGIPVMVMMGPIIPGLTDHEILPLAKVAAEHGALSLHNTVVRLNGDVGEIFEDWLSKTFPDRADKVLNRIKSCHGGRLNDSRFGTRMKGDGKFAELIHQQIALAKKKYFKDKIIPPYNFELYEQFKNPQMKLF